MSQWLKDRGHSLLDNAMYEGVRLLILALLLPMAYAAYQFFTKQPLQWIVLIVFVIFGVVALFLIVISHRRSSAVSGSLSHDNIDQRVKEWINSRFPRNATLTDDKLHFQFMVEASKHIGVDIIRSKARPTYITLKNRIITSSEQRSHFSKMPEKKRESVLQTIQIESRRSKLEPHWDRGNKLEFICLHKDIPITPELTEYRLIDSINDVKFAHGVIHRTINNLLKPPS